MEGIDPKFISKEQSNNMKDLSSPESAQLVKLEYILR